MGRRDELPTGIPIGGRLAVWRTRRGLTRAELADRAGMPPVHIAQWESGADWMDRHGSLAALAGALRLDPGELTGQPYAVVGSEHASVRAAAFNLRRQLAWQQDTDSGVEQVSDLAHRVRAAVAADEAGDDYVLARELPGLIRATDRTAAMSPPDHGRRAEHLRVRAHVLAARLLRRLGYRDLAWTFVHRACAGGAEMWVVVAEEIRLLIDLGLPEYAVARADRSEEIGNNAELLILKAFAEAMAGHRLRAGQSLSEAARRAEDKRSVAAVAVARAAVAVEYGAFDEVAEHTGTVDLSVLAPAARAHLLRVTAAAAARRGDIGLAVAALTEADEAAPWRLRLDPFARELIVALLARTSGEGQRRALRPLTEWIGPG
ncbi:helix-turn-helix transcriptional regulator [Streptomyces qinzhouensis]|uniref:Helix-turn-helix transcriptional regulator n=1 Tax=Streptomyces qinzhouensis TaxID=2599401 RepID=A0A5B8JSL9_9ACTN|nr:helix-turn-helix transcriptional regulator [Streptomyces qinzhouensis]